MVIVAMTAEAPSPIEDYSFRARSSAVLFQTLVNFSGELLDVTTRADLLRFSIEILLVIILYLV
jgi:hypothetical protein